VSGASRTCCRLSLSSICEGQSFIVTRDMNTTDAHQKDSYALTLPRTDAMRTAKRWSRRLPDGDVCKPGGYDGGYARADHDHGTTREQIRAHGPGQPSRSAATGTAIRRGRRSGFWRTPASRRVAVRAHPARISSFAMDMMNADGTFSAYDPEPLSGYTNMNGREVVSFRYGATKTPRLPLRRVFHAIVVVTTTPGHSLLLYAGGLTIHDDNHLRFLGAFP